MSIEENKKEIDKLRGRKIMPKQRDSEDLEAEDKTFENEAKKPARRSCSVLHSEAGAT